MPPRARRRAPARSGRASALLLFLPSAALLAFALSQRGRGPAAPWPSIAPTAPERAGQDGEVPGWDGTVELAGGVILSARLERLHPVPERQTFDVDALRARFPDAAAGGEPWRLVLSAAGEGGVAIDALAALGVGELRFLSSAAGGVKASEPSDPLASLLTPPAGALRAGETVSLVLWGVSPEGPVVVNLPGGESELRLVPSVREGSPATSSVAAIDARDQGAPGGEEQR